MKTLQFTLFRSLTILIFGTLSFSAFGQQNWMQTDVLRLCDQSFDPEITTPTTSTNCDTESIPAALNALCDGLNIPISIYCVELSTSSDSGETVYWSQTEYPSIHIRYEYAPGVLKTTEAIEEWLDVGTFTVGSTGAQYSVFQGKTIINHETLQNFSCEDLEGIDSENYFPINLELVTPGYYSIGKNPSYSTYPIEDYAQLGNIFSCDVFDETCGECSSISFESDCADFDWPVFTERICIDCESCEMEIPEKDKLPKSGKTLAKNDLNFNVRPNPFTNEITYTYHSSTSSKIIIEVFSSSGEQLIVKSEQVAIGSNNFQINTEELSSGIYYMKITNGLENIIERVVKAN